MIHSAHKIWVSLCCILYMYFGVGVVFSKAHKNNKKQLLKSDLDEI